MLKIIKRISVFIVIIGVIGIISNHIVINNEIKNEKKKVQEFFKENKKTISKKNTNYIAVLKIPKIKLEQGLVEENSSLNNVNKHVTILEKSDAFVLAAHSGNSKVSYFKNLYKLKNGDIVYLYYNHFKYKYKIVKHYQKKKDGKLVLNSSHRNTLILTTCKPFSFNKQLVYIAKLERKVKY